MLSQVIKALLTAVTATTCEVHEHSLMLAVRACFHIHLSSRNKINRDTAKVSTFVCDIVGTGLDCAPCVEVTFTPSFCSLSVCMFLSA
jgi:hypothetical protein